MSIQILIGTTMIVLMTIIHVTGLIGLARVLPRLSRWTRNRSPMLLPGALLTTSVLWIIALHTLEIWIWALILMLIGEFSELSTALYFSTVTATTLGYGDLVLSPDWQLLGSFEAMGGLILFGASTAFLLAVMGRLFSAFDEGQG